MNAMKEQVGGNHYSKLKYQPLELAYSLKASPCFTKLAKYITRDKGDVRENLDKALHVIEYERQLVEEDYFYFYEEEQDVEYDYDKLVKFSEQFTEHELIYDALNNMLGGYYEQATKNVQELKDKVCD